jgi:hypothetical protein
MDQKEMKRISLPLISLICVIFLISCEDQAISDLLDKIPHETELTAPGDVDKLTEKDNAVKYIITSGKHDADKASFVRVTTDTIRFRVKFDSTAIYKTITPNNQADINKLYGVSDCGTFHHMNSARFGWRWYHEKLEILAYTYSNGVRKYALLGAVDLNTYHHYEIVFTENQYIFSLNDVTAKLPRHCSDKARGYKLFPYFGGNETAPHDVAIWIEDLP